MYAFRRFAFVVVVLLGLVGLSAYPGGAFAQSQPRPLEAKQRAKIGNSGSRWMESAATLQRSGSLAGQFDVVTTTHTSVKLAGYTGAVYIQLRNADRAVIGVTNLHQFGVDGTWIGRYHRVDAWQEYFDPRVASATTELEIIQMQGSRGLEKRVEDARRTAEATCRALGLCN